MTLDRAGFRTIFPARKTLLTCIVPNPAQLRLHDTGTGRATHAIHNSSSDDDSDDQLNIWRPPTIPAASEKSSPRLPAVDSLSDAEEQLDFWLCPEIRDWVLGNIKAEEWRRQRLVLDREAEERRRKLEDETIEEDEDEDEDQAMESEEADDDDAPTRRLVRRRVCVDSDDEEEDSEEDSVPVDPKYTLLSSPTMHSPELAAQSLLIPELLPKGFLPAVNVHSTNTPTLVEESQAKEESQGSAMDIDTEKAVADFGLGLGLDIDMGEQPKQGEFVDVDRSIRDIEDFLEKDIDVFMPTKVTSTNSVSSVFPINITFSPKLTRDGSGEGRLF